jgi:hypothetical protein
MLRKILLKNTAALLTAHLAMIWAVLAAINTLKLLMMGKASVIYVNVLIIMN